MNPLLFAAVMDVVSSKASSGMSSELLYADDLVIMAPTMEQLGRCVADWKHTEVTDQLPHPESFRLW